MHAISPCGTVHDFPIARHAVHQDEFIRLYADTQKTEWVADVPDTWAVVAGHPKPVKGADPFPEHSFAAQQQQDRRRLKSIWLFGIIPLFVIRVGHDA